VDPTSSISDGLITNPSEGETPHMEASVGAVGTGDNSMVAYNSLRRSGGVMQCVLRIPTVSDLLPTVPREIASNGKLSALGVVAGWLLLVIMWIPVWLFSFLVTETGVYLLAVGMIFVLGRALIRLIAFPGASKRVYGEIEREFSKYMVRLLDSGAVACLELASAVQTGPATGKVSLVPAFWKRALSFRNRVFGVLAEILPKVLYPTTGNRSGSPVQSNGLNLYGNNPLVGDIGNLSTVMAHSRGDGEALLQILTQILLKLGELEKSAPSLLMGESQAVSDEAQVAAKGLYESCAELRDLLPALRPPKSEAEEEVDPEDDAATARNLRSMRDRLEHQSNSSIEAFKTGVSQILPMLDPPPHGSIFGLDILRGCMLSRYRGARQLWVPRQNALIDVVHIPPLQESTKAILYCNPNAGLFEVATGMSLNGGTVSTEGMSDSVSWANFYLDQGFHVFLFNYAGFGRSFEKNWCFSGAGGDYSTDFVSRLKRILFSFFFAPRPTSETLKQDATAVANHILNDPNFTSLTIHGESIGGMAAAGAARSMSLSPSSRKLKLLICDRTFCNLPAVAQQLLGTWAGYAIRTLAPFWETDVASEFSLSSCHKIVANDDADSMIVGISSLKAGLAFAKEVGKGQTKSAGWMIDTPLSYRMADWGDKGLAEVLIGKVKQGQRVQAPIWPADKHVSLEEAFHFAACLRRIGKMATLQRKLMKTAETQMNDEEEGIEMSANGIGVAGLSTKSNPLIDGWNALASCDGLCGSPLGAAVKSGHDAVVYWLCSTLVYGGQRLVEAARRRAGNAGNMDVIERDFDCRPSNYQQTEGVTHVYPKPIPEVLQTLRDLLNDAALKPVQHEIRFSISTLDYVVARLTSAQVIASSRQSVYFKDSSSGSLGVFLRLHCGHNNPFSSEERHTLMSLIHQANATS